MLAQEAHLLAYLGAISPKSRVIVQERLRAIAKMMQVPHAQVAWHEPRAYRVKLPAAWHRVCTA